MGADSFFGALPNIPDNRDGERLRDAIIDAARHLVHKHVEAALEDHEDGTYCEITIRPNAKQAHSRLIAEDDTTEDLYNALANLLVAVDSYDEWETEHLS